MVYVAHPYIMYEHALMLVSVGRLHEPPRRVNVANVAVSTDMQLRRITRKGEQMIQHV